MEKSQMKSLLMTWLKWTPLYLAGRTPDCLSTMAKKTTFGKRATRALWRNLKCSVLFLEPSKTTTIIRATSNSQVQPAPVSTNHSLAQQSITNTCSTRLTTLSATIMGLKNSMRAPQGVGHTSTQATYSMIKTESTLAGTQQMMLTLVATQPTTTMTYSWECRVA